MQPKLPAPEAVWLTVPEAAALMRLGRNRLYALVRDGRIPHRRVGVSVHIRRDVAETWQGEAERPHPAGQLRAVRKGERA